MLVMKFGGTSVQDAETILKAADIILSANEKVLVVVSAMAGVTNNLVDLIADLRQSDILRAMKTFDLIYRKHLDTVEKLGLGKNLASFIDEKFHEFRQLVSALDILGEISPKSVDMILSYGEILSSIIIFHAIKKQGRQIAYVDAKNLIKTDSVYTDANVDFNRTEKAVKNICDKLFKENDIVITGGFYGSNEKGHTTTLGRGGSDFSAAIIASAINSDRLEIWTDVNGIMTSDPRMIKDARLILNLSYTEASELAFFGAKVLHPKTIYPAVNKNIPVFVKNTFKPDVAGTKIIGIRSNVKMIKAVAFRKGVTVINVHSFKMLGTFGFLSKVFEIFNRFETAVDLVATSEVNISLTIDDDKNLGYIKEELEKFGTVSIVREQSILCAVGEGIRDTAGIAGRFFGALRGVNISMVSIGSSEVNLSIVIAENDLERAVKALHGEFFHKDINHEIFSEIQ